MKSKPFSETVKIKFDWADEKQSEKFSSTFVYLLFKWKEIIEEVNSKNKVSISMDEGNMPKVSQSSRPTKASC